MRFRNVNQLLKSDAILDFLSATMDFINLIENEDVNGEAFLTQLNKEVNNLYFQSINFTFMDFPFPQEIISLESKLIWPHGFPNFISKIGLDLFMKDFLSEFCGLDETVKPSLLDEVTLIYKELKTGFTLLCLNTENSIEYGLYQLSDSFKNKLGYSCVAVMKAIDRLHIAQ